MPFNLPGGPEVVVIILVALVVLGPEQLPKAMRSFGNAMGEIRKLSNGFQTEMRQAMQTMEEATSLPKAGSSSSSGAVETTGAEASPAGAGPDAGVTEVVASNPAPADPASTASSPATPAPAPRSISAADRAAG